MKTFSALSEVLDHYKIVKTDDELREYINAHGLPNFEKTYCSLTAFFKDNPAPVMLVTNEGWQASYGLVGVRLKGTVAKVTSDSAVIRFADGLTGVLWRQDFAWGRESEPLQEVCRVGSELTVVLLNENHRGGLLVGRKQL